MKPTGETVIDTPTATTNYSTDTRSTKKRIRVPKKLKQQLSSYITESQTNPTTYDSRTPYSNYTYGTTNQPYSNYSTNQSYTPTYTTNNNAPTNSYYSQTNYSYNPSYSQGTENSQTGNYSYSSYSNANSNGNSQYSGYSGYSSYSQGSQNSQYSQNSDYSQYSQTNSHLQPPPSESTDQSYSVFLTKPTTTNTANVNTNDAYDTMGSMLSQTTDDSLTRRVHMKIRVKGGNAPKKSEQAKRREAARVLLHHNGVVAPTDIQEESIDAQLLHPATTGELQSLDLSSSLEVPYVETVKPYNMVQKKNMFPGDDPSELTLIEPDPHDFGLKLLNSRFIQNDDASSDSETSTTLDSTMETTATTTDTVPSVMGRDTYEERFVPKEVDRVIKVDGENDAFSQQEAMRRKLEERRLRKEAHKLACEEAIRNGVEPPPTLTETATDELSTLEKEMRLEQDMQMWDAEVKQAQMSDEQRRALYPSTHCPASVYEQKKPRSMFDSSDDESTAPVAFEVGQKQPRATINGLAQGMGLFGSLKPMRLEDIKTYEPNSEEFAALRAAEEARREAEAERKRREERRLRRLQGLESSTATDTTNPTELMDIDEKYVPSVQGGASDKSLAVKAAQRLPTMVELGLEKRARQRPKRGTGLTTVSELVTANPTSAQYVEVDSSNPNATKFVEVPMSSSEGGRRSRRSRGNITTASELVTANPTSAQYVEVDSSNPEGRLYVEVPGTTTTTDGLTTAQELVSANPTSAQYVEADPNDPDAKLYVEVPGTTTSAEMPQTDGLTTVSVLQSANPTSAQYVEDSENPKGELYAELPGTTTEMNELTSGTTQYITATGDVSGNMYVTTTTTSNDNTYTYETGDDEEEEDYYYEEEEDN